MEKFNKDNIIDKSDLFTKIKEENTFLRELKEEIKTPGFILSDKDSETLEGIRAKYKPEMEKLLAAGSIDEYNKIADFLILPTVSSKNV